MLVCVLQSRKLGSSVTFLTENKGDVVHGGRERPERSGDNTGGYSVEEQTPRSPLFPRKAKT